MPAEAAEPPAAEELGCGGYDSVAGAGARFKAREYAGLLPHPERAVVARHGAMGASPPPPPAACVVRGRRASALCGGCATVRGCGRLATAAGLRGAGATCFCAAARVRRGASPPPLHRRVFRQFSWRWPQWGQSALPPPFGGQTSRALRSVRGPLHRVARIRTVLAVARHGGEGSARVPAQSGGGGAPCHRRCLAARSVGAGFGWDRFDRIRPIIINRSIKL